MVVNNSFPEMDQLAAGLAEAGLLSIYLRPYANKQRPWEERLAAIPLYGKFYSRTFGRRTMPQPLTAGQIRPAGVFWDFTMAMHFRLPCPTFAYKPVRRRLIHARDRSVEKKAVAALSGERAVAASRSCAEPVFRRMKSLGGRCVLNYPIAHHRFTWRYLGEEAKRQPGFADTLRGHILPEWEQDRLDREIELADRILLGSNFARETCIFEGVPAGKLMVVPFGADTSFFTPRDVERPRERRKLRVLFVGQVGQSKGISYLLKAAERLHASGNISWTLVGEMQDDGTAFAPYRHLFRHIPHVPRSELRAIYQQADVFVFPALVEGMGMVVLEAMASGLPVVTTPNGPGDIVRHGVDGFVVPPRDVDAIIDRLERLRADLGLREEMSRNARQRAQEFTWAAYREATVGHLKEWLKESDS